MNITRAALLCLVATHLAACDDAPCSTSADCFAGEVCLPDGRCREPEGASDMGADLDMSTPDLDEPDPDLGAPDMDTQGSCDGITCSGAGTCVITDGLPACACEPGYIAAGPSCILPVPTAVAAGARHTCAIAGGALYCWGDNTSGQLGTGDNDERLTPAPVIAMGSGVTAVAAGLLHTCAIKDDALWCWGSNEDGKVGVGRLSPSSHNTPQRITADTSTIAVSAGNKHTCATINDVLHCWGSNLFGQLGHDSMGADLVLAPARVAPSRNAQQIGAGHTHTCAANAGMLSCWGAGANGRLGNDSTDVQRMPQEILSEINAVAAGEQHTCAIQDSALLCWGDNAIGQLGIPGAGALTPTRVFMNGVTQLSVGTSHTCVIHDGQVKCWGDNRRRQAAPASADTMIAAPTRIVSIPSAPAPNAIAAGEQHTCAIQGGTLYCWGDNSKSQLGSGAPSPYKDTPTAVTFP